MAQIDCKRVAQRMKRLVDNWKENRETTWGSADAVLVALGKQTEVDGLKITAMQMFLLGYEFPELTFVFTEHALFCLVSKKRSDKYFATLGAEVEAAGVGLEFHLLHFQKGKPNDDHYAAIAKGVKASFSGGLLGALVKEKEHFNTGRSLPPLLLHLEAQAIAYVDIKKPVADVLAVKDDEELFAVKRASQLTAKVFQKVVKAKLVDIAQNARDVTALAFGAEVDQAVEELASKPELLGSMDPQAVEQSYSAMLRTGADATGAFVVGAENADAKVTFDVALLSLGIKYENYHASVTRTVIFHGSKYQVECYQHLIEAFDAGMQAIVPGEPIRTIHAAIRTFLQKSAHPELADHLPKAVGHGMGIEQHESLRLSAKNNALIAPGMVFFLQVCLESVPHPSKSGKEGATSLSSFTLALGDTVHVLSEQDPASELFCASLTRGASRTVTNMVYKGNDDSDDDDDDAMDGLDVQASLAERGHRAAAAAGSVSMSKEQQMEQQQLALQMQKKAEYEASRGKAAARIPSVDEITKSLRQFKHPSDYPRRARALKVFLDVDKETVFIPVNQVPVPFHISTIKTVSLSETGSSFVLRFNFHTTSQRTLSKDAAKSMVHLCKQSPDYSFIKEISIRSLQQANLAAQCRQIKEMQKANRQMAKQAQEESNLVAQERVRPITNPPKLADLQMRPTMRGRRTTGTLECHQNGFRFRSATDGQRLEFTFANIRHAFFQPCKNELTVLIHFHLRNPIMVGKKKAVDIQFFTEVIKSSVAIQAKSSMYDPEELDEERRERKLRKRLNDLFDTFVKKCEKLVDSVGGDDKLQFDIPFRDLGFDGVPHKSACFLMPTKGALVNLTEQPVFVCSLELVDHVHLQRVSFKSKHFEMMIFWKDWDRAPAEIGMIDRKNLDDIKRWLNEIPISFTQGAEVLNAKQVMKVARQFLDQGVFFEENDLDGNYKGVGWRFLMPDEGGGGDGSDDESEEGSAFGSEDMESEEEEDDEEEDAYSDEEDDESEDWGGDSDDGEDWEEMEKKAAAEDSKKARKNDAYEARLKAKEAAAASSSKRKRK